MMEARKERAVFVRLANKRIHILFKWQLDTNTDGTLRRFRLNRVRAFVCCLHQTRPAAADDVAAHFRQFGGEFLDSVVSGCGGLESRPARNGHPTNFWGRGAEARRWC